jgi:transposase
MAGVAIGVDTHKATLAACLVDGLGVAREEQEFPNDPAGHAAFAAWVRGLGEPDLRIGVEGSSSYGAALARHLVTAGLEVVEVPPQLSRRERGRTRRPGKSDPGDAFAIARVTLAEPDLPPVRLADRTRDLQLLAEARDAVVVTQTQARNRLHAHLLVLIPGYTATVAHLVTGPERDRARRLLRGHRGIATDLARAELAEVIRLGRRADALERQIRSLVGDDPLLVIPGCGHLSAAVLRGESGEVSRFPSSDAFAMFAGIAPLPASSGRTSRVRYNRRGNRRVNRAFWTIATWQAKFDPRARAYLARKRAEGKTWREALRCLKRHLVRHVFAALLAGHRPVAIDPLTT